MDVNKYTTTFFALMISSLVMAQKVPVFTQVEINANGFFDEKPWSSCLSKQISDSINLLIFQDTENLYVGVKSLSDKIRTSCDLFFALSEGEQLNIHASMKLGERSFEKRTWDPSINEWDWGNNSLWTANLTTWDSTKVDEDIPMIRKLTYTEGQEFVISKEKLKSDTFSLLVKLIVMHENGDFGPVNFPKGFKEEDLSTWIVVQL